jgi:hypothetical protein
MKVQLFLNHLESTWCTVDFKIFSEIKKNNTELINKKKLGHSRRGGRKSQCNTWYRDNIKLLFILDLFGKGMRGQELQLRTIYTTAWPHPSLPPKSPAPWGEVRAPEPHADTHTEQDLPSPDPLGDKSSCSSNPSYLLLRENREDGWNPETKGPQSFPGRPHITKTVAIASTVH